MNRREAGCQANIALILNQKQGSGVCRHYIGTADANICLAEFIAEQFAGGGNQFLYI
jgi:hypothetical protein